MDPNDMDTAMMAWIPIHKKMNDSEIGFQALQQSWQATFDPHLSFLQRTKTDGTVNKLLKKKAKAEKIVKESNERKMKGYCFDHSGEGHVEKVYFHMHPDDDSISHEMEYRQPGTTAESDLEHDKNDMGKYTKHKTKQQKNKTKQCNRDRFSPITTVAGQYLTSISFAAPDSGNDASRHCDLYPCYQMQLCVRTDDHRRYLYYDCFEYKPRRWEVDTGVLPSNKQYRKAMEVLGKLVRNRSSGYLDSEEESSDEEDRAPVELKPNANLKELKKAKVNVKLSVHAASFMCSRLFRIQVPLSSVCGFRVHSPPLDEDDVAVVPEYVDKDLLMKMKSLMPDENQVQSVLILELEQPVSSFAVRCVSSNIERDNNLRVIKDWTPGQVASRATRHYVCGSKGEINGIASHLAEILSENLFKYGGMEEEKPPRERKKRRKESEKRKKEKAPEKTISLSTTNSLNDDDIDISMCSSPVAQTVSSSSIQATVFEKDLPDDSVWNGWVEDYTKADDEVHMMNFAENVVERFQNNDGGQSCGMQ